MAQEFFLIYARAANGTIGKDGTMPWHLPADLQHFKRLTLGPEGKGLPMIMGRRTYDSFGRPLPGRRHIVMTRDPDWSGPQAETVRTVGEAIKRAGDGEIAVVGGAQIYELFLPFANRIELTEIHMDIAGDTHMPTDLGPEWIETAREDHPAEQGRPGYSFITLKRRG